MILLMTNPLRSAANSSELERAFKGLDYLVAVDFYLNETTCHANLILPTPSPAELPSYEFGLYHLSVRNVAKWSWRAVPPPTGTPDTWEVLLRLGAIFMGASAMPTKDVDDLVFAQIAQSAVKLAKRWPGLTVEEIVAAVDGKLGPERVIETLIRVGPYGDGFGRNPDGLTLARVQAAPHGIDLGPLAPRLREVLNTRSGKIELAPAPVVADVPRLAARMNGAGNGMVLIGRRNLRTSNSFMHNLPALVKGPERCTLQISPDDARRLGVADGGSAKVTSRVGSVVAPVEVTADLMPGVVSLPHGWGHDGEGSRLRVARERPGVNANALTDNRAYDVASGTAVLFGNRSRSSRRRRSGRYRRSAENGAQPLDRRLRVRGAHHFADDRDAVCSRRGRFGGIRCGDSADRDHGYAEPRHLGELRDPLRRAECRLGRSLEYRTEEDEIDTLARRACDLVGRVARAADDSVGTEERARDRGRKRIRRQHDAVGARGEGDVDPVVDEQTRAEPPGLDKQLLAEREERAPVEVLLA